MAKPAQMFDHELNPVKGWPSPYGVDKAATLSADETEAVLGGSVMSLDVEGEFRLGLYVDAMPIFALQNSTDFDVVSDDGGMVGNADGTAKMSGLVAVGSYELESTEYDSLLTFNPNDALTSPVPGAADAGLLTAGVPYTDTICGVVSAPGPVANERQVDVLRFWPVWLPILGRN